MKYLIFRSPNTAKTIDTLIQEGVDRGDIVVVAMDDDGQPGDLGAVEAVKLMAETDFDIVVD